jgi:hypothetical protein
VNRIEKRLIRKEITSRLDLHCRNCKLVKANQSKDPYCNAKCPIGLQLQELALKLVTDADEVKDQVINQEKPKRIADPPLNRGRWSDEEVFYLINHLRHFSIEHIAERLQRSVASVYNKAHVYKKANRVSSF